MKYRALIGALIFAVPAFPAHAQDVSATANSVYRDYNKSGNATTGAYFPPKADVRSLWAAQAAINALKFNKADLPCKSATEQGFVADGLSGSPINNLPKWTAWVASLSGKSGCADFSAGVFKFSGPANASLAAGQTISIRGSGKEVTEFWFTTGGFEITLAPGAFPGYANSASFNLQDGTVTATGAGTSTGVFLRGSTTIANGARTSIIQNVSFRGHTGSDYFLNEVTASDVTSVTLSNVDIYGLYGTNTHGNGVSYIGTSAATSPTVLTLINTQILFKNVGVNAQGYIQAVNILDSNITDVGTGVTCNAPATIEVYCNIINSQIDAVRHAAVYTNMQSSFISGNLFYTGRAGIVAGDAVLQFISSGSNIIQGNIFTCPGSPSASGVDISDASQTGNVINNNLFMNCAPDLVIGSTITGGTTFIGNSHLGGGSVTSGNRSGLSEASVDLMRSPKFISNGGTPTLSSCGTGSTISGTDEYGAVTVGTGAPTSCTVVFARPWPTSAFCTVTPQANGTGIAVANNSNNSALIIAFSPGSTAQSYNYACRGF
jgi:hypothetical protein